MRYFFVKNFPHVKKYNKNFHILNYVSLSFKLFEIKYILGDVKIYYIIKSNFLKYFHYHAYYLHIIIHIIIFYFLHFF